MSADVNARIIEQSDRLRNQFPRLSDYMWKWVKTMPEHNAFVFRDTPITFKKYSEDVEQVAKYLLKLGIKKGDRVAYMLSVRPEYNVLCLALAMIGAVGVGLNLRYTAPEISYVLNNARPRVLLLLHSFGGESYQEKVAAAQDDHKLEEIIVVEGGAKLPNAITYEEVLGGDYSEYDAELKQREAAVGPQDPLLIVYTSGSTGQPKGAVLTHQNIICNCLVAQTEILGPTGLQPEDHFLLVAPLNHIAGSVQWPLTALVAGATQVPMEMFHPKNVMDASVKYKAPFLAGVPAMWEMMISLPNFKEYDVSHVRYALSGAGVPSPRVLSTIFSITPNCCNPLAMTEAAGFISWHELPTDSELFKTTVGKVSPEIEMRIIDKEGQEVALGEVGELCFRGPCIFKGYFEKPEESAATFDADGYFKTGDLGYIDENNNLYLVGRAKEMFKAGGYNVYPIEIEERIKLYPGVAMVAVMGIPHKTMGEVGRAYVVPVPGTELDGDKIQAYLKDYLADYKIPRDYVFRDMLPLTNMGKIEKKYLRKEIDEEFAGK